jgi:hypothetical protein
MELGERRGDFGKDLVDGVVVAFDGFRDVENE